MSAARASVLILCALASPVSTRAPAPPTAAAAQQSPPARVTSLACVGCHPAEHRAWRASMHARAWQDTLFQRAYAEEPLAFCRGCHAPLADPARAPDPEARAEGVSCVSCHDRAREHVAARGHQPADSARDGVARCAPCHQFDFPGRHGRGAGAPMQDTVGEWRRARLDEPRRTCVDCHMPRGDHRVRGVEDASFLARAVALEVRVTAERGAWRLRARVGPGDVGHAFPTGDLFRRARLVAWTEGDEGAARERVFARHFEARPTEDARGVTSLARRERYDGRVAPPGPESVDEVTLRVPRAGRARLRWRFEHWRTDPEVAARQGLDDAAVRTVLAEGQGPAP